MNCNNLSMCFQFILKVILVISISNVTIAVPVLVEDIANNLELTTVHNVAKIELKTDEIEEKNEIIMEREFTLQYSKDISNILFDKFTPSPSDGSLVVHVVKRSAEENGQINYDNVGESPLENKVGNSETRASPIPFLQSAESESQSTPSSSGLPSLPGLPQMSGLSNLTSTGSATPTAVIGGFSFLIIPMPGMSPSNFGSALQAGQQMSQLMSGAPSLPG